VRGIGFAHERGFEDASFGVGFAVGVQGTGELAKQAAQAQLRRLSGKTHTQTCAAVLLQGGESIWTWVEEARLTMRALSDAEIEAYIRADTPLAACGAYKIEAHGRHLFTAIQGDQDVIKGLPLNPLLAELHKIGAVALA
jgi:septum formation protein